MIKVPEIVEYGYCHCGCGQKTKLATQTDKRHGHIKGMPMKFLFGHQFGSGKNHPNWKGGRKIEKHNYTNYVLIHMPKHPRSYARGYVYEHILVAERMLGKPLPLGAEVHHKDFNGLNNDESNLMVFNSKAEHARFHRLINKRKI